MITLIDVAIVAVILVVFYTVLQPLSQTVVIPPYRVTIESSEDEEGLTIEAVVQYRRPTLFSGTQNGERPDVQPVVTIGPVDGEIMVTDLAPREGGRRRMNLTIPMQDVEELEQLALNVQIGSEERVYLIDLR